MIKQWVDSRGASDHFPICLEILRNPKTPFSHFKLCATCLKNEDVIGLIQNDWIPYIVDEGSHVATHFVQNMARVNTAREKTKKYLDD